LERSVQAGRIGKSVISDPLAHTAIGEIYSFRLGTIMEDLLNEKGLRIQDLHGKNYTINNIGSSFVEKDGFNTAKSGNSPNGLDMNYNREYFNKFANTGGMVNILDPAMFSVSNPAIESKIKDLSTIRKNAAGGFIPNFAQTSNQIGSSGAQGGFYNLQNRFGNSRKYLGIKKFDENLPISALKNPIAREWLSAKYLKNTTIHDLYY
jgi:hypothetical protein